MQEIDTVLREFMDRKALFTSIDIANEVKRRGTWIPNRDVALYMRQHAPLASGGDYLMTLTTCFLKDGRSVPAYVYHPVGTFATEYREIAQSAMSPREFVALHPSAGPSRVWGCPIEQGIAGQMFHQRWIRNGAGFALDEEWDRHASG